MIDRIRPGQVHHRRPVTEAVELTQVSVDRAAGDMPDDHVAVVRLEHTGRQTGRPPGHDSSNAYRRPARRMRAKARRARAVTDKRDEARPVRPDAPGSAIVIPTPGALFTQKSWHQSRGGLSTPGF
jgi:hypothetical protein